MMSLTIDYSTLEPGQTVSSRSYVLDEETVADYTAAVDDNNPLRVDASGRSLAPPMALAALSLRGVVNDLSIPGGTLHAGQELEFLHPVPVGETVECRAVLSQNAVRGEWRFMVVHMEVEDGKGRKVMDGKGTIMLPIEA